jgi:hypothetical protein
MSAAEISEHVTLDRVPGVEPVHAAGASPAVAGGGGFAFFYAEAGIDGDGDVDGGLIDTLTDGVENGVDGALGFLGDLFGWTQARQRWGVSPESRSARVQRHTSEVTRC